MSFDTLFETGNDLMIEHVAAEGMFDAMVFEGEEMIAAFETYLEQLESGKVSTKFEKELSEHVEVYLNRSATIYEGLLFEKRNAGDEWTTAASAPRSKDRNAKAPTSYSKGFTNNQLSDAEIEKQKSASSAYNSQKNAKAPKESLLKRIRGSIGNSKFIGAVKNKLSAAKSFVANKTSGIRNKALSGAYAVGQKYHTFNANRAQSKADRLSMANKDNTSAAFKAGVHKSKASAYASQRAGLKK